MKVVGYSDRLSVMPGDTLQIMVSAEVPTYEADLVRLIHGDANPAGPGLKVQEIESTFAGTYSGKSQPLRPGSSARARLDKPVDVADGVSVLLWIYPTTPVDAAQTLMALVADGDAWFRIRIIDGFVQADIGEHPVSSVKSDEVLRPREWYRIALTYDSKAGAVALYIHSIAGTGQRCVAHGDVRPKAGRWVHELIVAAQPSSNSEESEQYNGKIEAPSVYNRVLTADEIDSLDNRLGIDTLAGPALAWDFSLDIENQTVTDCSGNARHGTTVQRPMRGATGHNWDGIETAWRHARSHYGAIHFHDDDLDDAGWTPEIVWRVPDTLPSAVYAVRLRAADEEDFVPFAVRPRPGAPTARIALLLPTFTYLAYANEEVLSADETREAMAKISDSVRDYPVELQDKYIVDNRLLSLYDVHRDGSGVCYSSRLRPLVNVRPSYNMPWMHLGQGGPHGLNADLHLVDWLHEQDYEVDVVTDDDLHDEGTALLAPYAVVLTGTHPEYFSREMVDATKQYTLGGGRLMYMGGNGMYWVTQPDQQTGHTVESRRRGPATRAWEPQAGEAHLSFNGELGGIWKFRGRSPQSWVGVGFTAQGLGPGRPYRRQPASFDPRVEFVFAGLDPEQDIGDCPSLLHGYGAAGYEIDRADPLLGTPHSTVVLASATEFSDWYQHVAEEIFEADSAQSGSVNPNVRCDMVLLTYKSGGAVFSTGSIAWASCLSYNGYDNTVSRVTRNVLDRFAAPEPL